MPIGLTALLCQHLSVMILLSIHYSLLFETSQSSTNLFGVKHWKMLKGAFSRVKRGSASAILQSSSIDIACAKTVQNIFQFCNQDLVFEILHMRS